VSLEIIGWILKVQVASLKFIVLSLKVEIVSLEITVWSLKVQVVSLKFIVLILKVEVVSLEITVWILKVQVVSLKVQVAVLLKTRQCFGCRVCGFIFWLGYYGCKL